MTVDAAQVSEALQILIDARLDTVDRMLLGRVPRQDRLAIVREVESQIFELLPTRGDGELGRDEVLAVLARLDPPEAYLPEAGEGEAPTVRTPAAARPTTARSAPVVGSRSGKAAGILGLSMLGALFLLGLVVWMLALSLARSSQVAAYILLLGAGGLIFIGSVVAIVLAAFARLRGAWDVVGLVTGVVGVLFTIAAAVVLFVM